MISTFRFIFASFYHYRRSNAATALGVIVATAVFTGAFLVGHSMRASLRHLALDAIGAIDYAILAPRLMPEVESTPDTQGIIQLQGTLESSNSDGQGIHRVRAVKIYGVKNSFWNFWKQDVGNALPEKTFTGRKIILNRATANALGVKPGDSVLVRLPRAQEMPIQSIFAHKDRTESLRLKVDRIIEDEGPGRFTLNPSQHTPMLAYVPLATLQKELDAGAKVNTVLVAGKRPTIKRLGQLGLHAEQPKEGEPDATFLSTDRVFFTTEREAYLTEKISEKKHHVQPVLTHLANVIQVGDHQVPYSTATACDVIPLADGDLLLNTWDEIALNAWTAEQLDAKVGDMVTLGYLNPNSASTGYPEKFRNFRLAKILPMEGLAIDRRWAPRVSGITDELTMADWDPPFPFDIEKIRPEDEAYWDKYKAAPKAFVSYKTGRRLWGTHYGRTTSLRVTPVLTPAEINTLTKELDPAKFGLAIQGVRRRALDASVGTTSFEGLFLALSFFVIAAALILVALMFRLSTDARARQVGLLAAVGFSQRRIAMLLIGEGLAISITGSLLGVLLGVLYAKLLIFGLTTWWLGAIGTPFLSLYVAPGTLVLGFVAGTLTSAAVIAFSIRRLMRIAPNRLLAGQTERTARYDRLRLRRLVAWGITLNLWAAVIAILVATFTIGIDDRYETVTFFLSGILTLGAMLATIRLMLAINANRPMLTLHPGNRFRFAARGAARHPMRSMAIVGMMSATVFLIVSIGAFRIEPITDALDVNGPTGGFQLVGQSDVPIDDGNLYHLAAGLAPALEEKLEEKSTKARGQAPRLNSLPENKQALLRECYVVPMHVYAGDNSSCLNLFRPGRPQILSTPYMTSIWDRSDLKPDSWHWKLRSLGYDRKYYPVTPVALEKNVANYSFQLWGGIGETFSVATDSGRPLELEVETLLGPSPFLGNLLIHGYHFQKQFPDIEGYQFFLIRTPKGKEDEVREILERRLGDYGFAAERTVDRIASVSIVQNTYLATFQSLGGLGLLLGLFGLLAVEVRNVMERRGELALLSAVGFQRRTLVMLLTLENSLLLAAGFLAGLVAATVAILPHLLDATASVPIQLLTTILALILAISFLGLPPTASIALRRIQTRDIQRDK